MKQLIGRQDCVYAQGGVGKTSIIGTLAEWLHKKGLRTLVFSADGGGVGPLEPHVHAGFLDFYQMDQHPSPFYWMDQIVSGFRPEDPLDPKTKWHQIDFSGEKVGAICGEGLTSWGNVLMDWAKAEHAQGRQIGQMEGTQLFFQDQETKTKYGSNTPAHFGIAQSQLGTYVAKARRLWSKGLGQILWTATEEKAELKKGQGASTENKPAVYGPKMPGQAATAQCSFWFTGVLHLDVVNPQKQPDGSIRGERKLFLDQHYSQGDPTPYLAKVNVNPKGKMPMVLGADFGLFLDELSAANRRALEAIQK